MEAAVARQVVVGAVADVVRGQFVGGSALPFLPSARVGGTLRWDSGRFYARGDVRHGFAQRRVLQSACAPADRVEIGSAGELPNEPGIGTPCVDVPTTGEWVST